MSRDSHPGVQCPHCRSHLALVPVPANAAPEKTVPAPTPDQPTPAPAPPGQVSAQPIIAKEEWQPPPVAEVLAAYAGRVKDSGTAMRGAARVRDSLNRAKTAAAQRRAAQKTARRTPRSA